MHKSGSKNMNSQMSRKCKTGHLATLRIILRKTFFYFWLNKFASCNFVPRVLIRTLSPQVWCQESHAKIKSTKGTPAKKRHVKKYFFSNFHGRHFFDGLGRISIRNSESRNDPPFFVLPEKSAILTQNPRKNGKILRE